MTTDNRVLVIPAGGPPFTFKHKGRVGLDVLQQLVGGSIEATYLRDFGEATMWCWGEARIFAEPLNNIATELLRSNYGYGMVGTFVLTDTDDDGYSVAMTLDTESRLLDVHGLTYHTWDDWDYFDALGFMQFLGTLEDANEWRTYARLPIP